jgi:hypothetical protein
MPRTGTLAFILDTPRIAGRLLIYCIFFELFLVLIDATVNFHHWIDIDAIRRLCNIAREDGLATWFQVSQTLLAGITLWIIRDLCRKAGKPKKTVIGWGVLAGFFIFMSADDGAKIHERIGTAFGTIFAADRPETADTFGSRLIEIFPSYNWQLVVLPFFIALGLFMIWFLWREIPRGRLLLLAAVACFAVAVGLDFMEGLAPFHPANLFTRLQTSFAWSEDAVSHFAKSLEEFLEMLGISLLWSLFVTQALDMTRQGVSLSTLD